MIIKGTSPEEHSKGLKRIRTFGLLLVFGPLLWLMIMGVGAGIMYAKERYKQYSAVPYRRLGARFPRIKKAPGNLFLNLVDFFCSSKTVENVILPLVADWRNEYFEALMKGRKWKARWISIRYRYSLIQVMGSGIISAIIKILKGLK